MLIAKNKELEHANRVKITRCVGGKNVGTSSAFSSDAQVVWSVTVPRKLGVLTVVLRVTKDGGKAVDYPFSFLRTDDGGDEYRQTLAVSDLGGCGLYFYEYLFLRSFETLFSDTRNNVDLTLSEEAGSPFRMLVYRADFHTPRWFRGGVMYHIFLDRFRKGSGDVTPRFDCVENADWENGVPQYAEKSGDPLSNNLYFGGNLWGVIEKLDYLRGMGVTVLYLSPLFEAATNHRYDTADYEKIDAYLGGEKAFETLLAEAHARGMKVVLDGVFNHTGDDSKYFNRKGNYPSVGAYQSKDSPYFDWYSFRLFPDDYECWWGIPILPRLNQENENCRAYFTGKDGVLRRWVKKGVDGWRLDVADELPDCFLDELRAGVKEESGGECLILGEVWENAAEKISYGKRRSYFLGGQLDGVMNYPFRNAVLGFLTDGDAELFYDILTEVYSIYPKEVSDALMNLLGTHDTPRILTVLADPDGNDLLSNAQKAGKRLDAKARAGAVKKLMLASVLQFTVYGVPSVYYGDEAGSEGYGDPFCRMPYPWGKENPLLSEHYEKLGKIRSEHKELFAEGEFSFVEHGSDYVVYSRKTEKETLFVLANMGEKRDVVLPCKNAADLFTGEKTSGKITAEPCSFRILLAKA